MEKILSLHCITLRMTINYDIKGLVVEIFFRGSRPNNYNTNKNPQIIGITSRAKDLNKI